MSLRKNRLKLDHLVGRRSGRLPELLAARAGLADGPDREHWRRKRESGWRGMESLEPRVLLAGDHPSLPVPFDPMVGDVITLNGQGIGSASGVVNPAGDDDLFRFTVNTADFVTVLANTTGLGSNLNSRLEIYDATGAIVAQGNSNGVLSTTFPLPARDGWVGFVANPGTYYARVLGELNTTGQYQIRVDTQSTAGPAIPAATGEFTIAGNITLVEQDTVYRIDTPAGAAFDSLATVVATADATDLNTRVEVYDSTGRLLVGDSDAAYLTSAYAAWKSTPSTRFYIRVRSDDLSATGPSTGAFALVVDVQASELDQPLSPITRRGRDETMALVDTFDTDSYRFMALGTGLTFITVNDFTNEGGFGLRLYDNTGTLLAFDDDFVGTNPQIETQLVGGQIYFLVVDSFEPPPTPTPILPAPYGLYIEAHHTNDPTVPGGPVIDDHQNTPAPLGNSDASRRQFENATPIIWGAPRLYFDSDNNPIYDHSYVIDGAATGRIHVGSDTDLFSFVPPVDMLGQYPGNNDDVGTAVFVGGAFSVADPLNLHPVNSRNLSPWDAGDFWFTGPQGAPYGFANNPDTPATAGPEIYALQSVAANQIGFNFPFLVVGGDFNLVIPGAAGPVTLKNVAAWLFDPLQGKYVWAGLGDTNGAVRAMTVFDPAGFDPDGDGPAGMTADPGPASLVLGGDFTTIAGGAANRIVGFNSNGYFNLGTGITGGSVRALAVYDPSDPGPGRMASAGPPPLGAVADPFDPPVTLFVGGNFTNAGGVAQANLATWNGATWGRPAYGTPVPNSTINGRVNALAVYDEPNPDANGLDVGPLLFIAGQFTSAGGVTVSNIVKFGRVATMGVDANTDPAGVVYEPRLLYEAVDTGIDGPVFAMTTWDPADVVGTIDPVLVIGGNFTQGGAAPNIVAWGGDNRGFIAMGTGMDAPVRALVAVGNDAQEPGIPLVTGVGSATDPQEVVYAGGDFMMAGGGPAAHVAQFAFDPNPFVFDFVWTPLNSGTNGPVYALANFDDANRTFDNAANEWDRNDRPSTRAQIIISGTDGSFLDTALRIYDSQGNLVYPTSATAPYSVDPADPDGAGPLLDLPVYNNTISPIFPDPAGMLDPSLAPGTTTALVGVPMWGGETYYIEVSSATFNNNQDNTTRATGRYNVSIVVEGVPPDLNGDGAPDGVISALFAEEPNAGNWTGANRIAVDNNVAGDGRNYVAAGTPPLHGNTLRIFNTYPSRFAVGQGGDLGNIQTVTDTDLYYFRANGDGQVEIRINTTNLADEFLEEIDDLNTNPVMVTFNQSTKTYNSRLSSVLRIFNNDLQQVALSSFNPTVGGEYDDTGTGTFGRRYFHRDARVVLNVHAGDIFFVQVESGQLQTFMTDPTIVDWRSATGSYELLINALNDYNPDNSDDHIDFDLADPNRFANLPQATPILINADPSDPNNGSGSITGVIDDNVYNPNDSDLFTFYAVATGQITLNASAVGTSGVALAIQVLNNANGVVVTGLGQPGQGLSLSFFANEGDRFYIAVDGSGGSQGAYRLDVVGQPFHDDHANAGDWINATPLTIDTFLGSATATGRIEEPGDSDVFRFTATGFDTARVIAQSNSESLNTFLRVYEIGEDGAMNPVFLRVAENDNDPNNATRSLVTFPTTQGRSYFIVVQGADPDVDFGNYTLGLNVDPTDDHPNFSAFPLASPIILSNDPLSGFATGSDHGVIEIPADDDVFRFTAPAGGPVSITLNRTSGNFDPVVRVFNSAGVEVPGSPAMDVGTSGNVVLGFTAVRNQTYYIVVDVDTSDDGGPMPDLGNTGAYDLHVFAPPNDDHPNEGEFTIASPIILSPVSGIGVGTGQILPNIDTDLFRFVTLGPGTVTINLTTPASNLDPRIVVYSSNFTVIPGSTDDTETASQTITATSANQVFYVLVAPDMFAVGSAQIGSYILTITGQVGGGGGGPGPDDHANAGNFLGATPIALDQRTGDGSATGIINYVGDTDLFRVQTLQLQPSASGVRPVYVQVTTPAGGLVDGTVRIFDQSFNLLTANSNGIPGATANVTFNLPQLTTFYILVEPVGANTGSYTVRVDTEAPVHFLYYPEGYSSTTIDEFVPLVNPNSFPVTYSIIARYETGTRDQTLISSGVIPANTRGGITINTHNNPNGSLVRRDTPYALEIQSDGQLGATFSHYDFGVTTGESFTNQVSTTWTFSEVHRDGISDPAAPGNLFNDFVLFYNPTNVDASVTITMVYDDGSTTTFMRSLGALRRGGLNFDTDSAVTRSGRFGVRISSTQPIVAAMSSYDIANSRGFGLLGNPEGGSVAGAVPSISTGGGVESSLSIFNATNTAASVNVRFTYSRVNLPDLVRTLSVDANSRRTFTLAQLGLVDSQPAGIRYDSSVPVTLTAIQYQNGDGDATEAGTAAGTIALFGDAFVNPAFAGVTYIESMGLCNPASISVDISIRFLFTDGTISPATVVTVGPHDFADVSIDQNPFILSRVDPTAFSVRVDAATPFIASFTHYDLFLGGGWTALGSQVGLTNPLSSIT